MLTEAHHLGKPFLMRFQTLATIQVVRDLILEYVHKLTCSEGPDSRQLGISSSPRQKGPIIHAVDRGRRSESADFAVDDLSLHLGMF